MIYGKNTLINKLKNKISQITNEFTYKNTMPKLNNQN